MMSMQNALNTSATPVTVDSKKGQDAVAKFRAQYNKAGLTDEEAQELNESQPWIEYLAVGFRKFSQKRPVFPVYLEIEVGGKNKDTFLAEMKAAGIEVSGYAKDIMSKPAWKPGEKQTVKFGRAKISDLGFTDPKKLPTIVQVWARIKELGHQLCEPADGPAIRLALQDQPHGDDFWIAMEQILGSDGGPSVFCVECGVGGERWLIGGWVYPDSEWYLDDEIVFRLRK